MTRIRTVLLTLAMGLIVLPISPFVATAALAAGAATEPAPAYEVLNWMVMMAGVVAMGAAGWAARRVAAWVRVKTGVEVESLLTSLGASAAAYAEEKGHQVATSTAAKLDSNAKLQTALDFARDRAKELGLDKKAETKLRAYIEAHLGAGRKAVAP